MCCIFVIMLSGWCWVRMRPARLVSYAFLYTTHAHPMDDPNTNGEKKCSDEFCSSLGINWNLTRWSNTDIFIETNCYSVFHLVHCGPIPLIVFELSHIFSLGHG